MHSGRDCHRGTSTPTPSRAAALGPGPGGTPSPDASQTAGPARPATVSAAAGTTWDGGPSWPPAMPSAPGRPGSGEQERAGGPDDAANNGWSPAGPAGHPEAAASRGGRVAADGSAPAPGPAQDGDEAWAMLAYMGAAVLGFVPPVAIYLLKMRSSPFVRAHAAQAVNFAVTMMLYTISALIVGGLLALDSVNAALLTAGGAALLLWLVALTQVTRAALAAIGGGFYQIPSFFCATVIRR